MNLQDIETLIQTGELDEALRQLTLAETVPAALEAGRQFLLGVVLHHQGELDAAEQAYRASLQQDDRQVALLTNLAHLLGGPRQNPREAASLLRRAIELAPDYVDAYLLLADFLRELDCGQEASDLLAELTQRLPDNPALLTHCMTFHITEQQVVQAALLGGRTGDQGLLPLAFSLMSINLFEAAEHVLQQLELHYPDDEDGKAQISWYRGLIALQQNECERAVPLLETALQHGFDDATLHYSLAWALLSCKRYQDAWPHFQYRATPFWIRDRDIPAWAGQPLAGKTISINSEQGAGDIINSLRFIPMLQAMGARVILDTYPDILAMLAECEGARAEDIEVDGYCQLNIDYQVRLLDIPAVLNLSLEQIPNEPYLTPARARVEQWQATLAERLPPGRRLRVGVVWAGNPMLRRDVNRSTALTDWEELFLLPGIDWVSLQKGQPEVQVAACAFEGLHLGPELQTFSDTAAVIASLDLVISVCTAVAHLAGAMGKPVWVLVTSRHADYRWHTHDEGSHWYPSARLFRQARPGGWRELLSGDVRSALARLVQDGSHVTRAADEAWLRVCTEPDIAAIAHWQAAVQADDLPLARRRATGRIAAGDTRFFRAFDHADIRLAQWAARRDWVAIERALAANADLAADMSVPAWECLIDGLLRKQRYEEAACHIAHMLERLPHRIEVLVLQGRLHANQQQLAAAEPILREALRLMPRHARACASLAWVLSRLGKMQEVPQLLQRAVQLSPANFHAWRELGLLAWNAKSFVLAEACARVAFRESGDANDLNIMAAAVSSMGRWDEALELRRRAVELAPTDTQMLQRLASTLQLFDRYAEARPLLEAACQLAPQDKAIGMTLAWDLLANGEMGAGWQRYAASMSVKDTQMPEWDGSDLNGAHLLVFQDQGYGDLFQFAHLIRRIRGGRITLAVHFSAFDFFLEQDLPCEVLLADNVRWDERQFDCYVAQMKLPFLLEADLVYPLETAPYLRISAARQSAMGARMADDGKLKIGFAWAGSARYGNDATRSTRLVDWLDLASVDGVHFYSLQKDTPSEQALRYPEFPMSNLAIECNTFADTAAAIANMDLVISPDTALAHLAGALGKPVWVLLPCIATDFRWMRTRTDVPWYPTATLFRQQRSQSWRDVLAVVGDTLLKRYPHLQRRG